MILGFNAEYRFLSNFYPCTVKYDGEEYTSAEHAYQAAKTDLPFFKRAIKEASTPGEAKKLGRKAPIKEGWDRISVAVMYEILLEKFSREPLKSLLKNTGDEYLVETNHWGDTYCGVCDGRGENYLGLALMKVREQI